MHMRQLSMSPPPHPSRTTGQDWNGGADSESLQARFELTSLAYWTKCPTKFETITISSTPMLMLKVKSIIVPKNAVLEEE